MTVDLEDRWGLGGSDIAALLGVSRYKSPFSVWAQAIGLTDDSVPTDRQHIGLLLEPVLASLFERETGLYVAGEQMVFRHRHARWARGHVDGLVIDHPPQADGLELAGWADVLGGVEFKTDGRPPWDEVPDDIEAQCRWYQMLTGLEHWWLGVMHARFEFRVYELTRDRELEGRMARAAGYLWHRHVLTQVAPPVDGSDATTRALGWAWPSTGQEWGVELCDDDMVVVNEWLAARRDRVAAEATEQAHANAVKAVLADAETATYYGEKVVSWKWQERRVVDTKGLLAAYPELVGTYTKTERSRVLRAHETAEV